MGLTRYYAEPIIREHRFQPISGDVLVLGRQTMYFTPEQAFEIITRCGYTPNEAAYKNSRLDESTFIGGVPGKKAKGEAIEDKSFFSMIDVNRLRFLDHDSYEGADIVFDLNAPVPSEYENKFDFIIDGGVFDNIFNPTAALLNISRMLRPGGRFLSFNVLSYTYKPYAIIPFPWYLDYFALNGFADCKIYNCVFYQNGTVGAYTPNLDFLLKNRIAPQFGLSGEYLHLIYMIVEKGRDSTWDRMPSQDIYRSAAEWDLILQALDGFGQAKRPDQVHSVGTPPVRPYYLDEFYFVDRAGDRKLPSQINGKNWPADYALMAKRLASMYRQKEGPIALLGRIEDFQEIFKFPETYSILRDDRVSLLSLYDAAQGFRMKFVNPDRRGGYSEVDKGGILPVSSNSVAKHLLVNCAPEHKDRLYLFNFANNFGAQSAVDLRAGEEEAEEYWGQSVNLPPAVGMGRTYVQGLP